MWRVILEVEEMAMEEEDRCFVEEFLVELRLSCLWSLVETRSMVRVLGDDFAPCCH